jgi:acyl carrier protein
MASDTECLNTVLAVIHETSGVSITTPDLDYYDLGVTSIQALPLLLELESRFEVSIPDDRFMSVRSARGLADLISELRNN